VRAGTIVAFAALAGSVALAAPARIDGPATVNQTAVRIVDDSTATPGNPSGVPLPPHARPVDVSRPDHVIGSGTPAGCTSAAVIAAVAAGGVITFDCGPEPVTIAMGATAKVFNDRPDVVLDGGGLVTLSGSDRRRILYMNTCDPAQVWTTSHCQDQDHPELTIQRMRFIHGDSTGETAEGGGGGAVFVRGGRVKVLESTFVDNRCDPVGPDVGGGALRVLSQSQGRAVVVASSTFAGNRCSNGGALSSIGVSWEVYNSVLTDNRTTGIGANPARAGTPGGGNGGAIALDGNRYTLDLVGSVMTDNVAGEGGGAIFFVSNDRTGNLRITSSELRRNPSLGFETSGFPGIFYLGSGPIQVTNSTIQ
jgi:hypothetical protein